MSISLRFHMFSDNSKFSIITAKPETVLPGIWRFTLGTPEAITPTSTRRYQPAIEALSHLPQVEECPIEVSGFETNRGFQVKVPLAEEEEIYGLGLQLLSFAQRGKKKTLRVNADPIADSGDSHSPVPFYVTTEGYGVLIDTARYATFYLGGQVPINNAAALAANDPDGSELGADALPAAYVNTGGGNEVNVEIPLAKGVDVYIFAGPALGDALQRYNLFSGGGALPPRWGLGFWYRCKTEFSQEAVLGMAAELREREIPCDVLGLEPGWHTHAYSCSFKWSELFPAPKEMLDQLSSDSYKVNLWEHAFTHPDSPIHEPLLPHSGDYSVWRGAVPDFLTSEARQIFAEYHESEHASLGVSGYKLDECDSSDYTGGWSFPEMSRFPSGADGEQMHSLLGIRYQDAIQDVFEANGKPTYGLVRNSHAFAAPYPFVLYSDLYDHRSFINAIAQSSFSGLLWTPEVRHATGVEDLIRRLQSVVFSPLAMVNAWYLKNPPWKQTNHDDNLKGHFAIDWEETESLCREVIQWRMRFLPYVHAAFVRYQREGIPPFRALVIDYPTDPQVWNLADQYLMGDSIIVAPVIEGETERSVYLPEGEWYDFWTSEKFDGGQKIQKEVPLDCIPLYVKSGTVLPLATPTLHTNAPESWELSVRVYGDGSSPATLFEESDLGPSQLGEIGLIWDANSAKIIESRVGNKAAGPSYSVKEWTQI